MTSLDIQDARAYSEVVKKSISILIGDVRSDLAMSNLGVRSDTIQNMLICLDAFAKKLFDFFGIIFEPRNDNFHSIYPAEYAFDALAQQVRNDLDVIMRALHHRTHSKFRSRLETADRLAYKAVNKAIQHNLIHQTTTLAYFQKQPTIRIIPYAPVAIVGIPLTPLSEKVGNNIDDEYRDLLSIPHEIGHQVYWRIAKSDSQSNKRNVGRFLAEEIDQPLQAILKQAPTWLHSWFEEIFADVFGCWVAGAASGLGIQELLRSVPNDQMISDDGEHPAPVVRPYIHCLAFQAITNEDPNHPLYATSKTLEQCWETWLKMRQIPRWFKPLHSTKAITVEEAKVAIKGVVKGIITSLNSPTQSISANEPFVWTTGPAQLQEETTESLQRELTTRSTARQNSRVTGNIIKQWISVIEPDTQNPPPPELTTIEESQRLQIKDAPAFDAGQTGIAFERLMAHSSAPEGATTSPWWLEVLEAGGWVTGPGSGNVQPPRTT